MCYWIVEIQVARTISKAILEALFLSSLLFLLDTILPLQPTLGRHVVRIRGAERFEESCDAVDGLCLAFLGRIVGVRKVAERRTRRE